VVPFREHGSLGYRIALFAMREMRLRGSSKEEEPVAIIQNDSSAVNVIQVIP